ncbi:MAG: LysM peptidoglycan-binding domain-containing protein [Candidatus Latescibacteria bacterium]|nr:LysM peptidoglycan-binding domain-containing protein [bacterium]MCB9512721.1 LysM peptidoglycan-binding domain-containing protein [Candidatus Latescibacterota bacterium]MCB9516805.1 LysM peptidoglycan-binding domain-containing protein [Candidatus Latescibacterota bacterium]
MLLAALALLTLGLLGTSGCSKKVTRQADVTAGDYYTEEEYNKLSDTQRAKYCDDLSAELDRLNAATAQAQSEASGADIDRLKSDLAQLKSQQAAQAGKLDQLREQIAYFESLPKNYRVLRGDCLWNISKKEQIYANPWLWPRIYEANKDQIHDPDLIYPDQVFDIPR